MSAWVTGAWAPGAWYGTAWYDSGGAPPTIVDIPASPGASDWFGKKKKKGRVIRYSDFESQEAYAAELAAASLPIARIIEPTQEDYEDAFGDDDAIIKALFLITKLH